ncbi:MAG TPA: penicillin acylase family protein, partial [Chloroflexota bacterium]
DWYLASGGWSDGYRARRIRERLTAKAKLSPDEIAAVHGDAYSIRARDLVPALVHVVEGIDQPLARSATRVLARWNFELSVESVGASIWSAFWAEWCLALARARFPQGLVDVAAMKVGLVGGQLLLGEQLDWFREGRTDEEIRAAFARAVSALAAWGGDDVRRWRWGKLHRVTHPHPLATSPALAELFSTGPYPTSGGQTVRAAGYALKVPFDATSGSTYRLVADLSQPDAFRTVQTLGQSGHLGSPHYRDQTRLWLENRYHPFWMNESDVLANLESETTIGPG